MNKLTIMLIFIAFFITNLRIHSQEVIFSKEIYLPQNLDTSRNEYFNLKEMKILNNNELLFQFNRTITRSRNLTNKDHDSIYPHFFKFNTENDSKNWRTDLKGPYHIIEPTAFYDKDKFIVLSKSCAIGDPSSMSYIMSDCKPTIFRIDLLNGEYTIKMDTNFAPTDSYDGRFYLNKDEIHFVKSGYDAIYYRLDSSQFKINHVDTLLKSQDKEFIFNLNQFIPISDEEILLSFLNFKNSNENKKYLLNLTNNQVDEIKTTDDLTKPILKYKKLNNNYLFWSSNYNVILYNSLSNSVINSFEFLDNDSLLRIKDAIFVSDEIFGFLVSKFSGKHWGDNKIIFTNKEGKILQTISQITELNSEIGGLIEIYDSTLYFVYKYYINNNEQDVNLLNRKDSLYIKAFNLDYLVSVNNPEIIKNELLYPNPATEYITINIGSIGACSNDNGASPIASIEIYDVMGIKIHSTPVETKNFSSLQKIDVSNLSPGVYFVKIGNKVEKFVKY